MDIASRQVEVHRSVITRGRATLRTCRAVILVALATLASAGPAFGAVRITQVAADGREVRVDPGEKATATTIRVPAGSKSIVFTVANPAEDEADAAGVKSGQAADELPQLRATRLRYRLDGHDDDWQDAPAFARMAILFVDDGRHAVGSAEARMAATSPGWKGGPERSPLAPYTLTSTAPPLAARATINFLSGAADEVVGAIGIDTVAVTTRSLDGTVQEHDLAVEGLSNPGHPLATPRGWSRSGSRDEISRIRTRVETGRPILAFEDDDPGAYGSWLFNTGVPVRPGDEITVNWRAAHDVGVGRQIMAGYSGLAPGTYWFRAVECLPGGQPMGAETAVQIVVPFPWHSRADVWLAASAIGLVAATLTARAVSIARMRRRLEALERAHALDRERARIARDLHDDIGAGLTEIAMQTDWVRRDMQGLVSPATVARAERACASAMDLVRSVDAIVWAVNPANDTLDRFVPYLTHSAEQFLDAAGVGIRFDLPAELPPLTVAGTVRHDLFLVVREAINNAVKHAQPQIVRLGVRLENGTTQVGSPVGPQLVITIEDDGRGFTLPPSTVGAPSTGRSGLANMRKRTEDLGGRFMMESRPGTGTRIEVAVPLAANGFIAPNHRSKGTS
jgi:signal transduction histidine kinase